MIEFILSLIFFMDFCVPLSYRTSFVHTRYDLCIIVLHHAVILSSLCQLTTVKMHKINNNFSNSNPQTVPVTNTTSF